GESEYYASLILDGSEKKVLAMVSAMGGMNVEEIAEKDPDALVRRHVDPLDGGLDAKSARDLAAAGGIPDDAADAVGEALAKVYLMFDAADATLVEINPLVLTKDRSVIALDSKVTIDTNALFRQEEVAELENPADEEPLERMAKERGLIYVKLDGDAGILANGAGLCMSTLDVVA